MMKSDGFAGFCLGFPDFVWVSWVLVGFAGFRVGLLDFMSLLSLSCELLRVSCIGLASLRGSPGVAFCLLGVQQITMRAEMSSPYTLFGFANSNRELFFQSPYSAINFSAAFCPTK
jgi:hypothetical protein